MEYDVQVLGMMGDEVFSFGIDEFNFTFNSNGKIKQISNGKIYKNSNEYFSKIGYPEINLEDCFAISDEHCFEDVYDSYDLSTYEIYKIG